MTEFMLNDQSSFDLQNWLQYTHVPDEHFYSTLAIYALSNNLINGNIYTENECVRFSLWIYYSKEEEEKCDGKVIRSICNFGYKDLHKIRQSNCLSANKFNLDVDPMAVFCQMNYLK